MTILVTPVKPKKPSKIKFTQIDGESFNQVMQKMRPELNLKVDNKLKDDGSQMAVDLAFNEMDDFNPERIAEQVPALKSLLDTRSKLRDLLSKADRSEELEQLLETILQNNDEVKTIADTLKTDDAADADQPEGKE